MKRNLLRAFALLGLLLVFNDFSVSAQIISTIVGTGSAGSTGDGGAATSATINQPNFVFVDVAGNLLISDGNGNRVRKVTPAGIISTIAGTGTAGFSGDGGAATSAQLNMPSSVIEDIYGNIYISDLNNHRIRKVSTSGIISTYAGTGTASFSGDGGAASLAALNKPYGLAFDGSGNLYVADEYNHRIRKINSLGFISTYAGTGTSSYGGDGGAATAANLYYPNYITFDLSGNMFIMDNSNHRIRKVNTSGVISTYAGTGSGTSSGDGGAATAAGINFSGGLKMDHSGNLYFAEMSGNKVRKINASGIISTFAGTGTAGATGDGGAAVSATLNQPLDVCFDGSGNLVIADCYNNKVRFVSLACSGTPSAGVAVAAPLTGTAATTFTLNISGATSATGLTYQWQSSSDGSTWTNISGATNATYVGSGYSSSTYFRCNVACSGGGSSSSSAVYVPIYCTPSFYYCSYSSTYGMQVARPGYPFLLYGAVGAIVDSTLDSACYKDLSSVYGCTLNAGSSYTLTLGSNSTTYAMSSQSWIDFNNNGVFESSESVGGVSRYTTARASYSISIPSTVIGGVHRMRVETEYYYHSYPSMNPCPPGTTSGSYYYGETRDYSITIGASPVLSFSPSSITFPVTTVGSCSDSIGTTLTGSYLYPSSGYVTITAPTAYLVSPDASTWANSYTIAYSGGSFSTRVYVKFCPPSSGSYAGCVTATGGGTSTSTCLSVSSAVIPSCTNVIITIAGNGTAAASGDGGAATLASINNPNDIIWDSVGNLYFTDASNNRIRKINTSGIISTIAGTGTAGFSGDGGAATAAALNNPSGLTMDNSGNIYFTDALNHRIRKISSSGIISTIAGTGTASYSGDGGAASTAAINEPYGILMDRSGNLLFADGGNHRIRKISSGIISTIAGTGTGGFSGDGSAATSANIYSPNFMYLNAAGELYFVDNGNHRIRNISTSGIISTIAGTGVVGTTGDGGAATSARIGWCAGVAGDASGNIYVTDVTTNVARIINISGIISQYAGTGTAGFTGDGGAATAARLYYPSGIRVKDDGTVFICDQYNNRIRKITNGGTTVGAISGASTLCAGTNSTFTDSTAGGTWSSSNTTVATISAAGVLYGVTAGTTVVSYTYVGTCGTAVATKLVTITPTVLPGPITGPGTACIGGGCVSLSDTTTGGTWSSASTAIAVVNTSGQVCPMALGTTVISYTVTGACGTQVVTYPFSVTTSPSAGTLLGLSSVCTSGTITLRDTLGSTGGIWTSSNPSIASVSSAGVVYGVSVGSTTITYTVSTSCGSAYATRNILVTVSGFGGTINGARSVCIGGASAYNDTTGTSVGVWAVSPVTYATISAGGVLYGVAAGNVTISYTVSGACGAATSTRTVAITGPSAGTIVGASTGCVGSTIALSDSLTGGVWESSNTSVASVNSSTGLVNCISAGSATITYTYTGTCGTASTTFSITVNEAPATPSAITGASSVCIGATTVLGDVTAGGVWSSSNASIATVNPSSGTVTGVATGAVTITYTVTSSCGSSYAIKSLNIISSSAVSAITGVTSVCVGATGTVADATPGGVWTSGNTSIASISSTGVITGIAPGAVTISYGVTGTCGTTYATTTINVNTVPSVTAIVGASTVCLSTSSSYTNGTVGGVWSSTATSIASITGSGVVYGLTLGTTTISYTVTNTCGAAAATKVVTVSSTPSAGTISGATTVCAGLNTTLTDASAGGVWTSSNTSVATVSSSGVVTGLGAGSVSISYVVATSCGTATATYGMTVSPAANAGVLSGATTVCTGVTTPLTSTVSGGTWSSAAPTIASVTSAGIVRGLVAGSAVISYTVSNSCGTSYVTRTMTVNASPNAGTISGVSNVCTGGTIALSSSATGGVWTSANTAIATISATGVVTGVAAGSVGISYTVSNTCGTATAGYVVSVMAPPSSGTISGATTVCVGTNSTFTESVTGGSWSSSNTAVATVSAAGVMRGVAAGTTTLSYVVSNSCATAIATKPVTVTASSTAGTISGLSSVCVGATITLATSGTAGGSWSSSNTSLATVSGGVVRGVAGGTVNISYSVTSACGTVSAYKSVTVSAAPTVSAITGSANICTGTSSTYTDATAGGGWISSNTAVATVNSSGVVTGVSVGSITLTYFITNGCGTASTTKAVSVGSLSAGVIAGATSIARGASTTYTNTVTGGSWSSSNTSLATINASTGLATGVAAGVDTIKYTVTNVCGTAVARKVVSITAAKANPGFESTTGVEIYPNPTTGTVNLKLPCNECTAVIAVTDVSGKIVLARTSETNEVQLDLSNNAAGVYIIQVNIDGELYTQKVILR